MSSITGNFTSMFFFLPLEFLNLPQPRDVGVERIDERPTSSVFIALNSSCIEAKVMNSVVHTGEVMVTEQDDPLSCNLPESDISWVTARNAGADR